MYPWNAYKILVRKPEGRPRYKLYDNIKPDHKEIECEDTDWSHWLKIESRGRILWTQ